MTFEEYCKLPDDDGPFYHELRHGKLVEVCRPKPTHTLAQKRLEGLLEAVAGELGSVFMEMPFRPNHDNVRDADAAYLSHERMQHTDFDGYFPTPEIVIEVLSPSNTADEILDKEKLCLETGAEQFWVVDLKRQQVKVSTPDGQTITYRRGQEIPLPLFGDARIAVDAIFQ
jgi:Uma2 family endonuclease